MAVKCGVNDHYIVHHGSSSLILFAATDQGSRESAVCGNTCYVAFLCLLCCRFYRNVMGCCGAGLGPSLRRWVESTQLRHKSEDTMGRPQSGREEGERAETPLTKSFYKYKFCLTGAHSMALWTTGPIRS